MPEVTAERERNVFLIGPMGAGKSAVGRRLAKSLGRQFLDSDAVIVERSGVDIPFIFEREGEAGFRAREQRVIDELTALTDIVLATGGGAAQDPVNRQALKSRGIVVYLHATVEQQLERTGAGTQRPLLATGDPREVLTRLMATREPQYREIADIVIDTDGRRVDAVAREIRKKLTIAP